MTRMQLNPADLIRQSPDDQDRIAEYVAGLPDASGTFTGTFSSEGAVADLLGQDPGLIAVEIDTYDRPNAAADLVPGQHIYLTVGGQRYSFEVDHVEPLGGNRVRAWCHRPVHHSVE